MKTCMLQLEPPLVLYAPNLGLEVLALPAQEPTLSAALPTPVSARLGFTKLESIRAQVQ